MQQILQWQQQQQSVPNGLLMSSTPPLRSPAVPDLPPSAQLHQPFYLNGFPTARPVGIKTTPIGGAGAAKTGHMQGMAALPAASAPLYSQLQDGIQPQAGVVQALQQRVSMGLGPIPVQASSTARFPSPGPPASAGGLQQGALQRGTGQTAARMAQQDPLPVQHSGSAQGMPVQSSAGGV